MRENKLFVGNEIFLNLKIKMTEKDSKNLNRMFEDKTLESAKLLYRAS